MTSNTLRFISYGFEGKQYAYKQILAQKQNKKNIRDPSKASGFSLKIDIFKQKK
jgi:hypothetical protein